MTSILLAAALWALQAPAVQQADSAPEPEIVIIGERMRRLKLITRTDRKTGVTRCLFKRHSGDQAFDRMMCNAVLTCAETVRTRRQMEACLAPHISAFAAQLKARREASR